MAGINDEFWSGFARESISKTIEIRDTVAGQMETFLSWVWGFYTAGFALATFLGFFNGGVVDQIILAIPVVSLMVARFFCGLVIIPNTDNVDPLLAEPGNASRIMEIYKQTVEQKKKMLRLSKALVIGSMVLIASGLVIHNLDCAG